MEYIIGTTIVKTVGIDFTLKCISTITGTCTSIYSLIGNLITSNSVNIINSIMKLDLEMKVRILESLIHNLRLNKHSETLSLCLTSLKECLIMIENELLLINTNIKYNNSLWILKSWRSYDFINNMAKINILNDMLDIRQNLFFNILQIDTELISEQSLILIKNNIDIDKKQLNTSYSANSLANNI
jgi:hypothetical protein